MFVDLTVDVSADLKVADMATAFLNPKFPAEGTAPFPALTDVGGEVLDLNTRTKLLESAYVRRYAAGSTLISPCENAPFVGCVKSGVLRLVRRNADGQEQIVGLMTDPDLFGHRFSNDSAFALEAATGVTVYQFERRNFEDLVKTSRQFERYLLISLLEERNAVREWLALLNSTGSLQRVGLFLMILARPGLETRDGRNKELEVNIRLSRSDVAHFLFTCPETISRCLHRLQAMGAIRIVSSSRFQLRDMDKLKKLAGAQEVPDGPLFRRLSRVFSAEKF